MKTTFKAGDKVRVVDSDRSRGLLAGAERIVASARDNADYRGGQAVQLIGLQGYLFKSARFELVEPTAEETVVASLKAQIKRHKTAARDLKKAVRLIQEAAK